MLSANLTVSRYNIIGVLFFAFLFSTVSSFAQDNSPYSRYGLGDRAGQENMVNRAMGGISAGYSHFQSINFINPASFSSISNTIFDIGGDITLHTLKSNISPDNYTSTNTNISYLQMGFPITTAKMRDKNKSLGIAFGLRPITRINYKLEQLGRLTGIDSVNTTYGGSGGMSVASAGFGYRVKDFSVGVSLGYTFGNKSTSTLLSFVNDTVNYFSSERQQNVNFGGLAFSAGMQYKFTMKKKGWLTLGAYAHVGNKLSATRSTEDQTYYSNSFGDMIPIDTVQYVSSSDGKVKVPTTIGFGFVFTDKDSHWTIGADYEMTNWATYRVFGEKDALQNSYRIKLGAEYFPATKTTLASHYFSFVKYRGGFYYGTDQIKLDKSRNEYGLTIGVGMPLAGPNRMRFYELPSFLNAGVEIGTKGNKSTGTMREGIVRFNIGVSMNARWFQKIKYD